MAKWRVETPAATMTESMEESTTRAVHLSAEDLPTDKRGRAVEPWQRDNWGFYDFHGEVHYPFTVGANLAGRVDLGIQERTDNGWSKTENRDALACHEAVVMNGIDDFWRSVWLNYGVAGEGVMLASLVSGAYDIEVCSNIEVQQDGDLRWYRIDDTGAREPINPATTRAVRFWRNHPKYRKKADSGLRSVQNECKELQLLKLALLAKITSRLASVGILFIPNSMSMPPVEGNAGTLSGDPLTQFLVQLFMKPMLNQGSAAAAMPVILRGPDDSGEKVRHIILDTSLDAVEEQHRAELRHTIANGIELPIETQTSISDTNRWNAWHVSESALSDHVIPVCRAGANLLTTRLLWPWLRSKGMSDSEVRRFRFHPDATRSALGLNMADNARQVYERLGLSGAALRRFHGIDDTDAPDTDEFIRLLGVKLNNPLMATWGLDVVIPPEVLSGPTPPGIGGFGASEPIQDGSNLPGDPSKGLDQS